MLTTLLTSIQTALTGSKAFILASLLPFTLFSLASAGLLYRVHPEFRTWVFSTDAAQIPVVTVIALMWVGASYVLSALGPTLLEALEGKHPPLSWFSGCLHARHFERRRALYTSYFDHAREEGEFEQHANGWMKAFVNARGIGNTFTNCNQDASNLIRVKKVLEDTRHGREVSAHDMDDAVAELVELLKTGSTMLNTSNSKALNQKHEDLKQCIFYVWGRHRFERIRFFNLLQLSYPGPFLDEQSFSSANTLAPTTMGNIGRTIRSYALTRYNMDLDIFWTRLQKTVRSAKDFHDTLQDTKILVDSLVTLTWLTALFTVGWPLVLLLIATSPLEFLLIGILGPLLTLAVYTLACRGYLVFSDLLRSAVDHYRLDLLKDLHIPLPYGSDEEKRLWNSLGGLTGYGTPTPIIYEHPGK